MEPSDEQKAFAKILRLATARERCSDELRSRLLREGFSTATVETALQRAAQCGAVDDTRYAEHFARSGIASGKGRHGIEMELERRGLNLPETFEWPDEALDDEGELQRALALLDAHPPRAKNKRDAAYRKLAQKGYRSSVASRAARMWAETHV